MRRCSLSRIALLVLLPTSLQLPSAAETTAWATTHASITQEDDCDKDPPDRLQYICSLVQNQILDPDESSPHLYLYQRMIHESSGANAFTDSGEMVRKKVQHRWWFLISQNKFRLTCDSFSFNVAKGSLLKFAVANRATAFIEDATETWQVPLNGIDASDGRTVLDYVVFELEKARGTTIEPLLKAMYHQLEKAGAKLRKDLTPEDRFKDPYDLEIKPLLAVWDKACYFSEGLAAVKKDGKWGYVDRQHQIKVAPKYDGAFSFSQGRAAVVKDGKWGYIDPTGKEIIPLSYAGARAFGKTGAEVTKDGTKWFTIDQAGLPVTAN